LVIFHLSQDEYQMLKAGSKRHGARNLSDFTRGEVLSVLNSREAGNHIEQSFSSIEQSIAELKPPCLASNLFGKE